jgi:hypothetical protein
MMTEYERADSNDSDKLSNEEMESSTVEKTSPVSVP